MPQALPSTSIHDRILTDLSAIITTLNLQGKSDNTGVVVGNIGSNVFVQMLPDESNVKFPAVLLTVEDEAEEDEDEAANFEEEAVVYPVRVLIVDHNSERYQKARPVYQLWRFILAQTLRGLPTGPYPFLPSTPECWDIRTRRLKIFDPKLPHYQFVVSGFVALCRTVTPQWRGGQPPG